MALIEKGEHRSPATEFKKGQRVSRATEFKKGAIPWIKNKHHSEETKRKMRQSHLGHTGKKAGSWKGGQTTHNGYVYILKRNHPRANNRGYVKRALLIAEKKVGRYLKSDEIPHHENEIKHDDRPENIKIMTAFDHKSFHGKKSGNSIEIVCVDEPPEEEEE